MYSAPADKGVCAPAGPKAAGELEEGTGAPVGAEAVLAG